MKKYIFILILFCVSCEVETIDIKDYPIMVIDKYRVNKDLNNSITTKDSIKNYPIK